MQQILLDTNIVIYFLKEKASVISLIKKYSHASFSISIITWIEILAGSSFHNKNISELIRDIDFLVKIQLNEPIGMIAARFMQENLARGKKKSLADAIIAATAMSGGIPLLTNNPKDFRRFKGLKIISPTDA